MKRYLGHGPKVFLAQEPLCACSKGVLYSQYISIFTNHVALPNLITSENALSKFHSIGMHECLHHWPLVIEFNRHYLSLFGSLGMGLKILIL